MKFALQVFGSFAVVGIVAYACRLLGELQTLVNSRPTVPPEVLLRAPPVDPVARPTWPAYVITAVVMLALIAAILMGSC